MPSIYELLPVMDTPGYAGLGAPDAESITGGLGIFADFVPTDVSKRSWSMPRLEKVWRPCRVVDPLPGQQNDYPCIGFLVPAFSRRAVDALRDLLEPNGELLPLKCSTGEFWAYNVTTVADVLDRGKSAIKWPVRYKLRKQDPVLAERIEQYEFHEDRLAGLSIFRIPESMSDHYVTQVFADRIAEHCLRGFDLRKIWPLPRRPRGSIQEMERRSGL